jgi:hypothetical protein
MKNGHMGENRSDFLGDVIYVISVIDVVDDVPVPGGRQ